MYYQKMSLSLKQNLIALTTATVLLSGCGGGGGGSTPPPDTTQTGYFIDSAVGGVDYTCGTTTSVTGSDGNFTYDTAKCSSIEFKLNGLSLGTIATLDINTDKNLMLQDLAGVSREDTNNTLVLRMGTLLQSLDDNNNTEDGITITDTHKQYFTANTNFSSYTDDNISDVIRALGKNKRSEFEVQSHILKHTKLKDATISKVITYPKNQATNIGNYTWVKIAFGESMQSDTITISNITLNNGKVFESCQYDDTAKVATCMIPSANPLADMTNYTVSLSANIKKADGSTITASTISFTTGKVNKFPRLRTGQTVSYVDYDDGWYASQTTLGLARSFTSEKIKIPQPIM